MTAIEELKNYLQDSSFEGRIMIKDSAIFEKIDELLTQDQQQSEELVKEAYIAGLEQGEDYLQYDAEDKELLAKSYYNLLNQSI